MTHSHCSSRAVNCLESIRVEIRVAFMLCKPTPRYLPKRQNQHQVEIFQDTYTVGVLLTFSPHVWNSQLLIKGQQLVRTDLPEDIVLEMMPRFRDNTIPHTVADVVLVALSG